jgi:hypothetical protein
MATERRLNPIPERGIAAAGAVQVCGMGVVVWLFGRFQEDLLYALRVNA